MGWTGFILILVATLLAGGGIGVAVTKLLFTTAPVQVTIPCPQFFLSPNPVGISAILIAVGVTIIVIAIAGFIILLWWRRRIV